MKNLRTALLILLFSIIIMAMVFAIYFIRTNTSFLSFNIPQQELTQNNQNPVTTVAQTQDLITLVPKSVGVSENMNEGIFVTERKLNLPEDYEVKAFHTGLVAPRHFDFHTDGSLLVADKGNGQIILIRDNNEDGFADETIIIDENLRNIHGVDFYEGDLYAAEENQVVVYRKLSLDGTFANKEILVADLPAGGGFGLASGHVTRTIVIGPDGKMYVSVGSSCNVCEEGDPRRATIVRYEIDGTGEEIFAEGLRNTVDFLFYKDQIWSVDNGRDRIGDEVPPEEVNIIEQGNHYGWPYCYGTGIANPEYPESVEFCRDETEFPIYEMQAHSAPLGLDFYPGIDEESELNENLFITFHGSWNRTIPTGYKVVRIDTTDSNAEPINFITGWLEENGDSWGRPVGIKFNEDGDIYISDDEAGAIYLVTKTS